MSRDGRGDAGQFVKFNSSEAVTGAHNPSTGKIVFTGEANTGSLIHQKYSKYIAKEKVRKMAQRTIILLHIILFMPLTLACNNLSDINTNEKDDIISISSGFDYNNKDLEVLKLKSLNGDKESIDQLVGYYLLYTDYNDLTNRIELIRWLKIGIDKGMTGHAKTLLSITRDREIECDYINKRLLNLIDKRDIEDIVKINKYVEYCIKKDNIN